MRLATVSYKGEEKIAVISGHGDSAEPNTACHMLPEQFGDMVDIISSGDEMLSQIKGWIENNQVSAVAFEQLELLEPIRRYRRDILCTGWNYLLHFEESKGKREGQDVDLPNAPTFFTKAPSVAIGANAPIAFDPRISAKWDYEAELVIIIGDECRSVNVEDAMDYVWGYSMANDVSQRDLQRRHGAQWLKGKSIDDTMPFGPWITTADSVNLEDVWIECYVNGEQRQRASVKQMYFNIAQLIAELSFGMTLYPGDIVLTGTPAGIGNAMEPPVYLKQGDEVEVKGTGIGVLKNVMKSQDLFGNSSVIIPNTTASK